MAIAASVVSNIGSANTDNVTVRFPGSANDVFFCFSSAATGAGTAPTVTLVQDGATWTSVLSLANPASQRHRFSVHVCMTTGGFSASTLTATWGPGGASRAALQVIKATGLYVAGTDLTTFRSSDTTGFTSASTVTLVKAAAYNHANNQPLFAFHVDNGIPTLTGPSSSMSTLYHAALVSNSVRLGSWWSTVQTSTITVAWTSGVVGYGVLLELRDAADSAVPAMVGNKTQRREATRSILVG